MVVIWVGDDEDDEIVKKEEGIINTNQVLKNGIQLHFSFLIVCVRTSLFIIIIHKIMIYKYCWQRQWYSILKEFEWEWTYEWINWMKKIKNYVYYQWMLIQYYFILYFFVIYMLFPLHTYVYTLESTHSESQPTYGIMNG